MSRLHKMSILCAVYCATFIGISLAQDECPTQPVVINTYGCENENSLQQRLSDIETQLRSIEMSLGQQSMAQDITTQDDRTLITDCSTVADVTGRYKIKPTGADEPFDVMCRRQGGLTYTVIQQRVDSAITFRRSWAEYRNGFGVMSDTTNFYLGNENIHLLTRQRQYELYITITDWDDRATVKYARYESFELLPETTQYELRYDYYTGTAGDALGDYHRGAKFSTFDRDNDQSESRNCAKTHRGGWWYNECDKANLNGEYQDHARMYGSSDYGIEWDTWRERYSFKSVSMLIRPLFDDN